MNNFSTKYMLIPTITLMILTSVVCGANLLTNGSFENSSGTGVPAGWTDFPVYTYAYVFSGEPGGIYPAADGTHELYLYESTLRQEVGVYQANTVYVLTFAVATNIESAIGHAWVSLDDGADGNFDTNSVGGKIITIDGSILKSTEKFYYGSLTLDTADPVYAGLVGHNLNVVLISGGQFHFDDISLTPYASVGTDLIVNGSFETPVIPSGSTSLGDPVETPWTISATYWAAFNAAGLDRPVADGLQSLYLFGGTCKQTVVSVIQANTVYSLDLSTSANDLASVTPVWSYIQLLAVPVGGGTSVQLAEVDLHNVVLVPNQWYKADLLFNSATNSSVVGNNLVVNLVSGGHVHFDGVSLAKTKNLGISPANNSTISFTFPSAYTVPLSWTLPASTSCDVYFGTNPVHMTEVIANQTVNSYVAATSGTGTYYWRIDVIDPNISTMPVMGPLMSFNTKVVIPLGDGVNRLTNGSFETPLIPTGQTNVGKPSVTGWAQVGTPVYWAYYNSTGLTFPVADGNQSLYLYEGTYMQSVGTIQANTGYSLDLYVAANDLASAAASTVQLRAVGTPTIILGTVNLGDVIPVVKNFYHMNISFDSATNPSVVGDSLAVYLNSGGQCHFDGASVIKYPSLAPSPTNYITMDVPGNATLRWTLPAPVGSGPVTCDVYLGTDPNNMTNVINNQAQSSYVASFASYGHYYWIIGVRDPGVNSGNPVYCPVMGFDVVDRCQGAKKLPGFTPLAGDYNEDCQVNFLDFAIFARSWIGN